MSIFITFEGVDAVGKSSLLSETYHWLKEKNKKILKTCEPSNNILGKYAKELVFENPNLEPDQQSYLFLADRLLHLRDTIEPALAEGKIVLCDRYHDSTIAYQGRDEQKRDFFFGMYDNILRKPDLTIWIHSDLKILQKRIQQRKEANSFDKKSSHFFQKTIANYRWLYQKEDRIKLVENNQGIKEAIQKIQSIIKPKIEMENLFQSTREL